MIIAFARPQTASLATANTIIATKSVPIIMIECAFITLFQHIQKHNHLPENRYEAAKLSVRVQLTVPFDLTLLASRFSNVRKAAC